MLRCCSRVSGCFRLHVAIGFKLVVLPKLFHTSSCFYRFTMPFKSFATLALCSRMLRMVPA